MLAVGIALTNLVGGIGFAQALIGRWRIALVWIAAAIVAIVVTAMTVWGVPLLLAVLVGSMVDAFLRVRRMPQPIRWNGIAAGAVFGGVIVLAIVMRLFVIEAFKFPSSSMEPTFHVGDHIYANKLSIRFGSPKRGDVIVFAMPCEAKLQYIKRVVALPGDTIEIRCSKLHINGTAVAEELVEPATQYQDYDEPRRGDMDGQWFARDASRYRETIDGRSFEVFHDAERPNRDKARAGGIVEDYGDPKDFPGEILRGCGTQDLGMRESRGAPNQSLGKLVQTGEPTDPCKLHRHYLVPEDSLFVMGDNRPNSNDSRYWGVVPMENVIGRVTGIWLPLSRFGGFD